MTTPTNPRFSDLTTIGVGGPASDFREVTTLSDLVEASRDAWASDDPWLVCGGGSNLLVADDGFDGVVIAPRTSGIRVRDTRGAAVIVEVDAGVEWDALVEESVANGWGGLEALSGIPGRVGAAPVQNIGAYGSDFADVAVAVSFLDEGAEAPVVVPSGTCGFGYRASVFKSGRAGVVTSVTVALSVGGFSAPIAYPQLADHLGVPLGSRVPGAEVREAVLALRRSKGMVFDPADQDSHGCGSFFINPVVDSSVLSTLPTDAPFWHTGSSDERPTVVPLDALGSTDLPASSSTPSSEVKLSAAWLISRAGISRGFALPGSGAAVSSKHSLAIVNRGTASAADVAELARFIQTRVASEFGVLLQPEPRFVGIEL